MLGVAVKGWLEGWWHFINNSASLSGDCRLSNYLCHHGVVINLTESLDWHGSGEFDYRRSLWLIMALLS